MLKYHMLVFKYQKYPTLAKVLHSSLLQIVLQGSYFSHLILLSATALPDDNLTRSGPKIPAAGLFGGRQYFGFGHSRDNSFGFELLDAFLLIKTRWQKMKKPSRFFPANFFEAISASKWPPRPNVTSLS